MSAEGGACPRRNRRGSLAWSRAGGRPAAAGLPVHHAGPLVPRVHGQDGVQRRHLRRGHAGRRPGSGAGRLHLRRPQRRHLLRLDRRPGTPRAQPPGPAGSSLAAAPERGAGARRQVLASLAKFFPLFAPTDTLARDSLIVFAIGVAYKLVYVALFLSRTANAGRTPPAAAPKVAGPESA